MKQILLLLISVLMISNVAMADHIGLYSDATGESNVLSSGINTTTAIIQKFSVGATGSRFKVDLSSSPGSTIFAFNKFDGTYATVGSVSTDLAVTYGAQCLSGSIIIGTLVACWAPGSVRVAPAQTFPVILYTDCNFAERVATGGVAQIVGSGSPCAAAVEATTWGRVKALYQ